MKAASKLLEAKVRRITDALWYMIDVRDQEIVRILLDHFPERSTAEELEAYYMGVGLKEDTLLRCDKVRFIAEHPGGLVTFLDVMIVDLMGTDSDAIRKLGKQIYKRDHLHSMTFKVRRRFLTGTPK